MGPRRLAFVVPIVGLLVVLLLVPPTGALAPPDPGRASPAPNGAPPAAPTSPPEHAASPQPPVAPAAPSPDLYPSAGAVSATAFVNYNLTQPGNFASVVDGWQVGTPTYIPETNSLWFPTAPGPSSPYPEPSFGPTLVFNLSTAQFTGVVRGLTNASSLTLDPATGFVYASIPANDTVEVIDPTTELPVQGPFSVGSLPGAMVFNESGSELFVANYGSNNLTVINVLTRETIAASISAGTAPVALAYDSPNDTLFVADAGSTDLVTINTTTMESGPTFPLGGDASGVAFSAVSNSVAVTVSSRPVMFILNPVTLTPISLPDVGTGAGPVVSSPDGFSYVVGIESGTVLTIVNASSGCSSCQQITVGASPTLLYANTPTGFVYDWSSQQHSVGIVSLALGIQLDSSPSLSSSPMSLAYDTADNRVFVADGVGDTVSVLNATTLLTDAPPIALTSKPTALVYGANTDALYLGLTPGLAEFNASNLSVVARESSLPGAAFPLLVDRPHSLLWVAGVGSGLIGLNLVTLAIGPSVSVPATFEYAGPCSAILGPAGENLFVVNGHNGTILVVNTTTDDVVNEAVDGIDGVSSIAYDAYDDSIYALGANLTLINATTLAVEGIPVALPAHSPGGSIVYDDSRQALFVTLNASSSTPEGLLIAIDGASVADAGGSFTSIEVGQGPVSAFQVLFPGRFSEGDAEIWVANAASGTVSVVSSPLAITLFSATPSPVDLGSAINFQLQYVGGAGPAEISYGGLPAGCASSNVSQLSCVPTESGSFTVTVTLNALFDGIATASTSVIVEGALEATETVTGAAASNFDVGSSVSFAAAVIGGLEPYAYLWEFGDGNSSTASSGTHAYTLPGTYAIELEVTDSLGATTVNVTSVTIHPDPVLRVSVTPSTTTDVDFPLSFVAAIAGGAAAVSEQWYVGTTLSGNGSTFSATWESSGHYNVTFAYTDAAGVSLEQVTPVVIEPPVRATVSVAYGNGSVPVGSGPVTVGESVELVAALFGGTAPYVVDWNFGDGSFAVGLRAQHVYGAAGNYSAYVNITDAVGGTISAPLTISVVAPASSPPPPSSSSSGSSNDLPEGVVLGALIGLALGAMVVYVATRSKRRGPPPPPSPYVPPAAAPTHSWKEE